MREDKLDQELRKLDVPCSEATRNAARALFAQVLDCPGGMRIGTIHAFCQSLLRRFPLEAAIAPQFQLMEDPDTASALHQALETEILETASRDLGERFAALSQKREYDSVKEFAAKLYSARGSLRGFRHMFSATMEDLETTCRRLLTLEHDDLSATLKACRTPHDEAGLRDAVKQLAEFGTPAARARLEAMMLWLRTPVAARDVEAWRKLLLTLKDTPLKPVAYASKKYQDSHAHLIAAIESEAERFIAALRQYQLLEVYHLSITSLALIFGALRRLDGDKARRGLVDYEDLIAATQNLLRDPGAAWVLFRLDGGIDHLLLDEVQDTSPAQWDIARVLTEDFFSGVSVRESHALRPRTIFAVGDFKQSIFSFQGAKPRAFLDARADFSARVRQANQKWRAPSLDVSFRSSAPVLQLVDAVFANPLAAEGMAAFQEDDETGIPRHRPARQGNWGRVEIWPKLLRAEKDEAIDPWKPAMRANPSRLTAQRMAGAVAMWLREHLGQAPAPVSRHLRPGMCSSSCGVGHPSFGRWSAL
ncbi:MAG: UvrD-helicase domain-containing protein [Acetobacteraceae bacterium]